MKSVKFRMIAIALLSATMPFTAKAQDKELIVRSLGDKDKRQMYFTLSDKGKICLNQLKENEIEVPKMLKPLFK